MYSKYDNVPLGGQEIKIQRGSDTVLVMFHGFVARPQVLLPIIDDLQDAPFDVYAPLVDKFGKSIKEFKRGNLHVWLKCVDRVMKEAHEKYRHVFVFGHSLGGLFALYAADKFDFVEGVVTFATPFNLTDKEKSAHFVETANKDDYRRGKALSWGMTEQRPPKKDWSIEIKGIYLFILRDRLKKKLKNLRVPVLNIHSRRDEISAFESQQIFSTLIPPDKFVALSLDKSMHTCFDETETKTVADEISRFVSKK